MSVVLCGRATVSKKVRRKEARQREREEIWSSSKEKSMNSFVELALIKSNYASFVVVSFFSSKRIESPRRERGDEKGKAKFITIRSFFKTRSKICTRSLVVVAQDGIRGGIGRCR